ncbi:hypothetical protein D3C80_1073810 [compost metagenome]
MRLGVSAERPVVPHLGFLEVARAFHDRHGANFKPGPFARCNRLDREAIDLHRDGIVHKDDADGGFAACRRFHRCRAGFGVLRDVGVKLFQVVEGRFFPHDLHQRGEGVVRGAGRVRVGHLDFAFVSRIQQIAPAGGHLEFFLCQQFGVVAPAQCPGVNANGTVAGTFGLFTRPVVLLIQQR